MSLVPCPECGRKISTSAEACPQCGCPRTLLTRKADEPGCYACSRPATTRCQNCNLLSCAYHVQSIVVTHRQSDVPELRCEVCYDKAVRERARETLIRWLILFAFVIGILVMVVLSRGSSPR